MFLSFSAINMFLLGLSSLKVVFVTMIPLRNSLNIVSDERNVFSMNNFLLEGPFPLILDRFWLTTYIYHPKSENSRV